MLKQLMLLTIIFGSVADSSKKSQPPELPKSGSGNQGAQAISHVMNQASTPNKGASEAEPSRWYILPEWWLCILGVPTLVVISLQTKATANAAKASEKAAKAALDQVELLKSKERARVAVKILPLETLNFFWGDFNSVKIEIENFGPTHAFNVRASGDARATIEGLDPLKTEFNDLIVPNVIRANSPPLESSLLFFFPEEWFQRMEPTEAKILVEAMGVVEYNDVFGEEHTTKFSYVMNVNKTSKIPNSNLVKIHPFSRWRRPESPKENHAT